MRTLLYFGCRDRGVDSQSLTYVKPYCRIAPYLVGMVLGYLLLHSKDWRLPTKVLLYSACLTSACKAEDILSLKLANDTQSYFRPFKTAVRYRK